MGDIVYRWTDGNDEDFHRFHIKTEEYYNQIAGGLANRTAFVQYNASGKIEAVIIAFDNGIPVGCAGLKRYSSVAVEIKRVWVEESHRRRRIAEGMMHRIEHKAIIDGYDFAILQTRDSMKDAVGLYARLGYTRMPNYPPYDKLEGAICFQKQLRI